MWRRPAGMGGGSRAESCDLRQQIGVVREVRRVHEGKTGGALTPAGDDQRGDLDDLAVATGGRTRVLLCRCDVGSRGGGVTLVGCGDGEQGMPDRVHRCDRWCTRMRAVVTRLLAITATVRSAADPLLTAR